MSSSAAKRNLAGLALEPWEFGLPVSSGLALQLVVVATGVGLVVLLWVGAELLFPH